MSIPRTITEFLDRHQVRYRHLVHAPAYTAQEIAHAQHVSGKALAKTVMVMAADRPLMAVLPASHHLELGALGTFLKRHPVRLATEKEFERLFPGCEVGAMPPLGTLYHLDVWVDVNLKERPEIVFNAGTHTDAIQMSFADFARIVQPRFGSFAAASH
jgi:Ala-tRNA(Pro) deacylase